MKDLMIQVEVRNIFIWIYVLHHSIVIQWGLIQCACFITQVSKSLRSARNRQINFSGNSLSNQKRERYNEAGLSACARAEVNVYPATMAEQVKIIPNVCFYHVLTHMRWHKRHCTNAWEQRLSKPELSAHRTIIFCKVDICCSKYEVCFSKSPHVCANPHL